MEGTRRLVGNAHVFGDDINTDYIIAGKYTKTLDYASLAKHIFEDITPDFREKIKEGDFIVAGKNFGCGSSREQAPIAIKYAGIRAVLAQSFARIFFRNAINLGIPAITCDTTNISPGDMLELHIEENYVKNLTTKEKIATEPFSPVMIDILRESGLVSYLKKHGQFALEHD